MNSTYTELGALNALNVTFEQKSFKEASNATKSHYALVTLDGKDVTIFKSEGLQREKSSLAIKEFVDYKVSRSEYEDKNGRAKEAYYLVRERTERKLTIDQL